MSNRTKGNVKPSNSERASRLLTTNKFLSFSEASKNLSSVYKTTDATDGGGGGSRQNDTSAFDCEIGTDFQHVFKHMAKKDVNTKMKALEEFIELCRNKNPTELLSIARFWFRVYRKLANSLEWNIRNASHEAQYRFISSIDYDLIIEYFEPSINEQQFNDYRTGEISFQTLITMSAVMWNSCFDAYSQPFQSARNVFRHLFSREKTIHFLLVNCDSILNYCLYFIFNKIPIELFYNTSLPTDSIRMFEDHQLGTCLLGLSTMINELMCFYVKNNIDDTHNVYECLEKIFIHLNEEFVRSKGLAEDGDRTTTTTNATTILSTDKTLEKQMETIHELEMSRKEKKKLRKEMNNKNDQARKQDSRIMTCSLWNCTKSNNDYIRIASFQALTAFTRLTSFLAIDSEEKFLEKHSNISTRLWFKLYKGNYFPTIMNGMVDSTIEIRGISWVLASHLLSNNNGSFFNLWSVINRNDWLTKTLKPFINNGMKSSGSIIDFGIDRIGFKSYLAIYPELSYPMESYFSALSLICPTYRDRFMKDFNDKINLITMFICSFNQNQSSDCQFLIFDLFLTNLLDSFNNIGLLTDMLFLIELFFNISYLALLECFKSNNDNGSEQPKQIMITSIVEHLNNLLKRTTTTKDGKRDLFLRSQVYLNHLLLINRVKQIDGHQLFETQLLVVYENLLANFHDDDDDDDDDRLAVLRFLTESYYHCDGYFSYDYYCTEMELNYERNVWKVLKQQLNQQCSGSKQVKFEQDDDIDDDDHFSLNEKKLFENCTLPNRIITITNEPPISLLVMIPSLNLHVIRIVDKLIAHLDRMFETKFQSNLSIKEFENEFRSIYYMLIHLEYITRSVSSSKPLDEHCSRWLSMIYSICSRFTDDKWIKYRYMIAIGSKILDVYIVHMAKSESSLLSNLKMFLTNLDPFAFCIVINHLDQIRNVTTSDVYEKFLKNYFKIIDNYVTNDEYESLIIHRQLMIVFKTVDENRMDFETAILEELLDRLIKSYNNDNKNQSQKNDETFKLIGRLIDEMCDYYSHIDNIVKHQFFIRFPSILIDLYQILLNNPQKLFLIENFFENFYKHSQMLLQRYSQLVSIDSIICDDNEDEILKFMDNVEGFMSTITKSYTYEQNDYFGDIGIKQCALQLSFIVDHFVFTIGNGDIIRGRIRRFISLILFSLSTLKCDDYETVSDMIIEFMKNLNRKFLVTCTEFQIQNDFSILHDLYAISNDDIVLPLLQFIEHHHDNDNNLAIYMKKMSTWNADEQYDDLVRFAQINSLMITIANGLFYFGNDDDDHHRQQLLIILIRQLFKNIYLLEKFIIISKRWNLLPLAKLNVIESIIDEYKSHLPTLLKEDESSIMMAIFQSIDQQQQQQPEFATLPFIAYLLEKYPSTNMSLANICEMNSNWKNCQHQQATTTTTMDSID
nr:uncharacterized protein LOC124491464 [Dermatophagoides farinae]